MDKTETMLVEIGALCSAFEGLAQGQTKRMLAQFREVCEKARLEITRKDKRIAELEGYIDAYSAIKYGEALQRIAELDALVHVLRFDNDGLRKENKRLDAALAEIANSKADVAARMNDDWKTPYCDLRDIARKARERE